MIRILILWLGGIFVLAACSGASSSPVAARSFSDDFSGNGLLREAGRMDESANPNWWVNSGAYLYFTEQGGQTIQGSLPVDDPRRLDYYQNNPSETDDGYHPQNIFRLVTRARWKSYTQQVYFKVNRYILSSDPHRQGSNGLLLFNHYLDGDNLYYTGLRVDGAAVIKKKINAMYYTLASHPVFPGSYDRDASPNLIPLDTWIGIRSVVKVNADRSVNLQVYADIGRAGQWILMVEALDSTSQYGGPPIDQEGFAGLRTDFMDVEFSDYSIVENE
jgi:hypothetical protein